MTRTLHDTRDLLREFHAEHRYLGLSTLTRKRRFGWTKASTRRQLICVQFCGKSILIHKKAAPALRRVQNRIRAVEARHRWKKWAPERIDTWNWRPIRGGKSLSYHAHGIALDIDPGSNPYLSRYHPLATTDIPVHVYKAFMAEGFSCGVMWTAPCDVMHIQWEGVTT